MPSNLKYCIMKDSVSFKPDPDFEPIYKGLKDIRNFENQISKAFETQRNTMKNLTKEIAYSFINALCNLKYEL